MKKCKLVISILCLCAVFFSGCRKQEAPIAGLPMPQGLELLKIDQEYYFQTDVVVDGLATGDSHLYHLPAGDQMPALMCSTPGCTHDTPSCSAYMVGSRSNIGYFQDRLYMLSRQGDATDGTVALLSIDPVTWERKQERTLDPFAAYFAKPEGVHVRGLFSENRLVLLYSTEEPVEGGNCRLQVLDLATGKIQNMFQEHFDTQINGEFTRFEGNQSVVGKYLYTEEDGLGSLPESSKFVAEGMFTQFDLETGETRQLLRGEVVTAWKVEGNTLFYSDQKTGQFRELDLTTGEIRHIPMDKNIYGRCFYEADRIIEWDILEDPIEQMIEPGYQPSMRVNVSFYTRDYQHIRTLWFSDGTHPAFTTEEGIWFQDYHERQYTFLNWDDLETAQLGNTEPQDREPRDPNGWYSQG